MLVSLADYSVESTSSKTLGVMAETPLEIQFGSVMMEI
jgi:hypothetical protein